MTPQQAAKAMREACEQIIRDEWAMKTFTHDTQNGPVFRLSTRAKSALKAIRAIDMQKVLK